MFPPEFVPIESRGMSVITALIISFLSISGGFLYTLYKRDFKRINESLREHEMKLERNYDDISEMKTNIALTFQAVTRIEKILDRKED